VVLATAPDAPKTTVLHTGANVALSIERAALAQTVRLIRGPVRTDTVDGIAPAFVAMTTRGLGEMEGQANSDRSVPLYPRMTRIVIRPAWVGLLDCETRLPSAVARAIARLEPRPRSRGR
jgi:hypothetical protein